MEVFFRMQKIKSIIKKIGAISTGAAFLGATLTGALAAADLKDYPTPFVDLTAKKFSYLGVVGTDSQAVDNLGLADITAGLSAAKVPGTGTSGTVSVVGGKSEDVPLGDNIASTNQLDKELTDSEVSSLLDSTISFQGSDYDISEFVELGQFNNISAQTSIAGAYPDDDYKDRVVLTAVPDAIKYYFSFDESIQVNKTKTSDALNLKFLGKTLKITSIDSASKFTANVGTENYLKVGDSVTTNTKVVKLIDVGSGGNVIVSVDGVQDVIDASTTKTINSLEIKNDATFYTDTKAERSAWLITGKDATESYTNGDAYVGEDKDDPQWVWNIGNLNTIGSTSINNTAQNAIQSSGASGAGPFIGVELDHSFRDGSDEQAVEIGKCIDLPNNYVSVCLDSLTVADTDYSKLQFELSDNVDLSSDSKYPGFSTASTIHVSAGNSDGLKLLSGSTSGLTNLTKNTNTEEVWIVNQSVFYKNKDNSNKKTFAGNVTPGNYFAQIVFQDTKDTNLQLNLTGIQNGGGNTSNIVGNAIILESIGDSTTDLVAGVDSLRTFWTSTAQATTSLGATKSSEEAGEVVWQTTNLGTKDENHRTKYGIVVKEPKSQGASDKVELSIPGDQVQANVVVKGIASSSGGTTSGGVALASYDLAPSGMLDTQVTTPANYNLILVGGPAVNRLSAQFLGVTYPAYGEASGLKSGEAVLSLKANGEKVALIVAGWDGTDTQRAAAVLKNSEAYKGKLTGTEVKVSGTTSNPTIVSA